LDRDANAALSDFEQALQLNPISPVALRNSVHVLADRLNQPREALQAVNQLLALNENDADALASRSVLYARRGDRQAAVTDLQRLLRVSKKPKALFQAACTLSLTSNEAETDAQKAMTLLARAVQAEPLWLQRARTDPDLENVRQTEGFRKLVADSRKLNQLRLNLNNQPPPGTATTVE
jgi:tetratricopeptide (TPR) repeat protein